MKMCMSFKYMFSANGFGIASNHIIVGPISHVEFPNGTKIKHVQNLTRSICLNSLLWFLDINIIFKDAKIFARCDKKYIKFPKWLIDFV